MFHYLNNQYPFSHFIQYGCWNITNYCWASTKAAFCCLGACSQFASSKLTTTASLARQNTGELAVSSVRARSGQIQSKLSLSKDIENEPRCIGVSKLYIQFDTLYIYDIYIYSGTAKFMYTLCETWNKTGVLRIGVCKSNIQLESKHIYDIYVYSGTSRFAYTPVLCPLECRGWIQSEASFLRIYEVGTWYLVASDFVLY